MSAFQKFIRGKNEVLQDHICKVGTHCWLVGCLREGPGTLCYHQLTVTNNPPHSAALS